MLRVRQALWAEGQELGQLIGLVGQLVAYFGFVFPVDLPPWTETVTGEDGLVVHLPVQRLLGHCEGVPAQECY